MMSIVTIMNIVLFLHSCFETYQNCCQTISWQLQRHQKALSWHLHAFRKPPKRLQPITPSDPTTSDRIHRLPPEIRIKIYHYLVPHHYVVQPEFDNGKIRARFGLLASTSTNTRSQTFIRSENEPPSTVLRTTLEDGGSFLHQTSKRLPATKTTTGRLICGDGEAWKIGQIAGFFEGGTITNLLRTSKLMYCEAVDVLYSKHTFSFFGPEMLQIFMDQVGLEGLRSVRHMHLAVPLPSRKSSMKSAFEYFACTMKRVASDMPRVQHLDVEIVAHQGPVQDPEMLSRYIAQIFGDLALPLLETKVLRMSVLQKDVGGKASDMKRWRVYEV